MITRIIATRKASEESHVKQDERKVHTQVLFASESSKRQAAARGEPAQTTVGAGGRRQ